MSSTTELSLGSIIFIAVKPILKIYMIIGSGYLLGKKNILTVNTAKQLSRMVVVAILPCLIFDKIVNNLNNGDIKQIGIVAMVSVILYTLGGLGTWFIYYISGVPKNWLGGCLSVGLFPNVAELPIAYVSSLSSVFGAEQVEKGISYVIIFLSTYCMIQFNLGAIRLIEYDYKLDTKTKESQDRAKSEKEEQEGQEQEQEDPNELARVNTAMSNMSNLQLRKSEVPEGLKEVINSYHEEDFATEQLKKKKNQTGFLSKVLNTVKFFIISCKNPISLSLIIAIGVAMIPWVQALFVVSDQYQFPDAPDKNPPLSFVMNFTSYISQACVPIGILILGSTLSRLQFGQLPKYFWVPPLLIAFLRLIILPIIGLSIVNRLKHDNWFVNDDILVFVCCISFGLPTATTLIYVAASYSNGQDIQMTYLSLVYAFQYPILSISLPFVTTYTIKKIVGF